MTRWRPSAVRPLVAAVARVTAGAAVLLLGGTLAAVPAAAHTELVRSAPADGTQLTRAPGTIALTFTDDLVPGLAHVTLRRGASAPQRLDTSVRGAVVTAVVPDAPGGPGRLAWTVGYRVVSADGHPVSGTVRFTAPAARASSSPQRRPAPAPPAGSAAPARRPDGADPPGGGGLSWGLLAVAILGTAGLGALAAGLRRRPDRPEP